MIPKPALAEVSHYQAGDQVRIYYNPDDPSIGVIENGLTSASWIETVVAGSATVFGGIVSSILIWMACTVKSQEMHG